VLTGEIETKQKLISTLLIVCLSIVDILWIKMGRKEKQALYWESLRKGKKHLRLPSVSPQPSTGGNFDMNHFGPSSSALPPLKDLGAPMSRREKVRETPEFFWRKI